MSRWFAAVAALLAGSVAALAQKQPGGLPPRSSPADYAAQVSVAGLTYAASLVPAVEVKRLFAFDISKSYVVFEVAVYPASAVLELNPDAFVARSSHGGNEVRCADSDTVAAVIQQKNAPIPGSRTQTVTTSAEIGHESGTDPYTGQRVHGTYTAAGVAVTNRDPGPSSTPAPGGYPQDRDLLERQLWAKSLPHGQIRQALAGYLYFPSSELKKKSSGVYELEYLGLDAGPVLNGNAGSAQVVLHVPAKSR